MAQRLSGGRTGRGQAARIVERLRRICLGFPEANERISHGEPTWFAGTGKVFAMLDDHHHGAEHLAVWLPQPLGAQEVLIASRPDRFFRPPYVGASGWVGVVLDDAPDWEQVARLVRDAYMHVAGARLRRQLVGAGPPASGGRAPPRAEGVASMGARGSRHAGRG